MTAKTAKRPPLPGVLDAIEPIFGAPAFTERPDDPLLDHLLVAALAPRVGAAAARECVRALTAAFLDLNEARSSPIFELVEVLKSHVPSERASEVAHDVRMVLQDVWDGTHGLDLEPLRSRDAHDQRAFLKDLPNIHGGAAAAIFQLAIGEGRLALGPREQRFLERAAVLPRSANVHKLRQNLEKKIRPGERMRFAWLAGSGSRAFETAWDPAHPFCALLEQWRVPEVIEREKEQKRQEIQRKADEKRRAIEAAKKAKKDEIERKKREREDARKRAVQEKKDRIAEKKRLAAEKVAAAKAAAKKKAEAKKAAEKAKAAAKKKAQAKAKKATPKKPAKKAPPRKRR
jgi:hypothetical protein